MSNHYTQYLIDNDAEDHTVTGQPHINDPFLPRHFVDWVTDKVSGASAVDVDKDAPDVAYIEYNEHLTRERERVLFRVANECGYHLTQTDEDRETFTFALLD